jgi:hypothetical protein
MKKILLSLVAAATLSLSSFGQAPEGFKYQAVVRDAGNTILNNQAVGMRMTILQGSIGGITVYQETFATTTNGYGLVNLEIGSGTTAYDFTTIDWANGPYFMETAVDVTGGTMYTVMGTSQFMSVPYALYAKTSGNIEGQCGLSIGQTYQGGIIFYLDASGCHGLISAAADQSSGLQWCSTGSNVDTYAYGSGIGSGEGNSQGIRRWQGDCASCDANEVCQDLSIGVYTDWYLPSKYELNLMYQNIGQGNALGLGNIGDFVDAGYWSSTEYDTDFVWYQNFVAGVQVLAPKSGYVTLRAVRAF